MATPNPPDQSDPGSSHMLRVPHKEFLRLRLLTAQLEDLSGRKLTRAQALSVALQCARNATDDELSEYL